MSNGKKWKMLLGALLAAVLVISAVVVPLQSAFALSTDGAQTVKRGDYYELPEALSNYVTSGKTLEFDLNMQVASNDVLKFALCYDKTRGGVVSTVFNLYQEGNTPSISVTPIEDGWYHYVISLATVAASDKDPVRDIVYLCVNALNIQSVKDFELKINHISFGVDVRSLPEAFTEDYDVVTLADLGLAGTDFETPVSSGTYTYKGTSETKSVIVKLGWKANITGDVDWKLALDTFWNATCMVWFRPEHVYFCPGDGGSTQELFGDMDPVTGGKHDIEFGRLRVTAGPHYGEDYVFFKLDGEVKMGKYTDYYQTEGGYAAYSGKVVSPSYTVCFVDDGVSKQGFSGFAKPDEYVTDIDYINLGDIIPGGVAKDTVHSPFLGYDYPFTSTSKTHSTVVKYLVKTGNLEGIFDGSVMVVDIGGNCGFCRSYIPSGEKKSFMFGWEIDGCTSGAKTFTFESNTWYACEQGRLRVASGINKGKDFVYFKIDGNIVSSFYANPASRPFGGQQIYVEATNNIQILGYNELRAKYYVDDELYLNQLAQKGYLVKQPDDPRKDGQYFVGWYTDKVGGTLFNFAHTQLASNIDLYARFTTETVTATFDPANGTSVSNVTVGKNCLIPQPAVPSYSDGKYEYVFVGWKNMTTGQMVNFATERISANTTFIAQYKEKEYSAGYYAQGKLIKTVPFVLSNPTVAGKEPDVPAIPNTTGAWEAHSTTGLTGSITVNAVYTVKKPTAIADIRLSAYAGSKIYLNTDLIHDYLSTDMAKQTAFVREYTATTHEYQDYQNTTFKWTDNGRNSKYTVYFADNADFNNAYIVTATTTSLVNKVGIFTPGKTYYWYVCGNNTGKCSAVDTFKIVNTPVRYITAGKVTNMRDLGGYETKDGAKVKYGLVYRGASLDEFHSHVDDEARNVFNYLGMQSEIELRGGLDHKATGWDENNKNVNYIGAMAYEGILTLDSTVRAQYKATFTAMADEKNYPFFFHCSAGADRTGAFAYLLNGLLGVPYENLREDYELTSFSEVGLRPADGFSDGSFDNLNRLMIEQYSDGTGDLQTAIQNYLIRYFGVSTATIDSIKNIMLDKGAAPNDKPYTITVDVLGKKQIYQAFDGIYFMPEAPKAIGKLFKGFYNGATKYNGYAKSDLNLVAVFDDIQYDPYDTISMKDLGYTEEKVLNHTNTACTYEKTAETGGRLFQFILQPIGDMQGGDGPQLAITNDWSQNSYARAWFQNNTMSHLYYGGGMDLPPDLSKVLELNPGQNYEIQFAIRVMRNPGYEGKKIFEITVDGELLLQYIGCQADLSDNMIFFHGATGAAYFINKPVYKTVSFYDGNTLLGTCQAERCELLPKVNAPAAKKGVPFAGWYTAPKGGKLWDENADLVYSDMALYAHFANVKVITANVDGKILTYRVEVGKTLEDLPKPQKAGHVFTAWLANGKPFTGKVTANMNVTAAFEAYSFDDYDEISLRDLGIYKDLDIADLGETNNAFYNYHKAAKTGGRVFKAIYIPSENMINGPQVSFSEQWSENYFAKLYFTKYDQLYVYSSGIIDGLPTMKLDTDLLGGKEYVFEVGVRVLNNKGYKGVKVFTVYLNGELIFEEFDNKANIDGDVVFFQGLPNTGLFRNIDIYKTVSFYEGENLISQVKVLRGQPIKSIGNLPNKASRLFKGWMTEYGQEWNFETDCVYLDTALKAKFQKRTYPILLMVDNVLYKRINVFVGDCADIPDVPVKEGYEFVKWLCEDGSDYDMQKPVNGPITLVASFKAAAKPAVKPQKEEKIDPVPSDETEKSSDNHTTLYILFGVIGLAVIAAETGAIIYQNKKRSK